MVDEIRTYADRLRIYDDYIAPNLPFYPREYLEENGFFEAPASTKYHGAYDGGLFEHSFNVMLILLKLTEDNGLVWGRPESPYIIGFFHDLCKIDSYTKVKQVATDGHGNELVEFDFHYEHNKNTLLNGHGDKSIMLLSTLTDLTEEEVACIRYHMGAFTDKEEWNNYTNAIHKYPNVLWTHHADMIATHICLI